MKESFKRDIIIRVFYLIGITIILITLIYFNIYTINSKTLYLIIPLVIIGLGFLIGTLYLRIKFIRTEKNKNQVHEIIISKNPISNNPRPINNNTGIRDNSNMTNIQEANELIIDWGNKILQRYLEFYDSAIAIFPNLKASIFKFKRPYFRIELFWKYDLKDIEIEFQKIIISDENLSGAFLHESKEDFYLFTEYFIHDTRTIEITDFPFSLRNIKKLLNYYSANDQAKYLINNDLLEYSELIRKSHNLIQKKFWIEFDQSKK
ncbi:MAG: hypothetical protein ACTSRC_20545 [Candidatus Helarchaeota archaeon]